MDYRSEHVTADCGAKLELATVIHEGREFTALGAIIDEKQGFIFGYVSRDETELRTWDGQAICPLRRVSSWESRVMSRTGLVTFTKMFAYACRFNGRHYTGRGQGSGMCLRLRSRGKAS
jgi:hypothetical protein